VSFVVRSCEFARRLSLLKDKHQSRLVSLRNHSRIMQGSLDLLKLLAIVSYLILQRLRHDAG
jgi:hypothetical protein